MIHEVINVEYTYINFSMKFIEEYESEDYDCLSLKQITNKYSTTGC